MNPIKRERLAFNVANSPKRASVVTNWAIGGIAAVLALVTPEQRDAMLAALPIAPVWLPLIAAAVVFVTQMWPQFNLPVPPEPSDEAVVKTVGEAVPPSDNPKTVTMPANATTTETLAERRAREDKELAERRAAEDAELQAPLTQFAIDEHDDDTLLQAIRLLSPNVSDRTLEKIRWKAEQLRLEKLKSQSQPVAAPTTKGV